MSGVLLVHVGTGVGRVVAARCVRRGGRDRSLVSMLVLRARLRRAPTPPRVRPSPASDVSEGRPGLHSTVSEARPGLHSTVSEAFIVGPGAWGAPKTHILGWAGRYGEAPKPSLGGSKINDACSNVQK